MLYTKVWIVRIDNPIVEISVDSDTSGSEQLHQRGPRFWRILLVQSKDQMVALGTEKSFQL